LTRGATKFATLPAATSTPQAAVNGGGLILSGLWMRWGE
jgi:hypothetical protein